KDMGGKQAGLWESLSLTLSELDKKLYPHTLPENPVRLREKYMLYKRDGYLSLVHKGYGNKVAEKINDLAKLWLLSKWANHVNRVTSVEHLFSLYNIEAEAQGWKQIESSLTIRNFLYSEGVQDLWYGHRYGELKSKEKFALQHSTRLPSMRDSLWYSDGTKLNYYYLTEDGKIETTSVYEVMDAFSEILLGHHISKTEDFEAQFKAYKMAVQFSGYRPYQLGYDNQGGHKKLENAGFLNKLAHLSIKAQPYNGKSKTIENAFDRFQAGFLKRDWFFTGQNITAKKTESRANMEFILTNKSNLPSLQEIKYTYAQRRMEWNNAPHPKAKNGETRMEMYRNSHNPEAVKVDIMDMVDIFWLLRPEPVTLNAYGLSFTEKKVKYDFLVYKDGMPDQLWLRKNIDKKFWIKFDPEDMSLIYLYEKDATGLRFITVAETKVTVSRGKQEQEDFEAAYLTQVNNENKVIRASRVDEMDSILEQFGMLPEQNGLISPRIKGVSKKGTRQVKSPKASADTYGKYEKELSNAVADDETDIYSIM
ncbi:MAG: kinase, partial [Bacteroidota bacterium]